MLYYLMVSVFALVSLLLVVVILLQQGKGGDIASAFGGGSSQAAFGARAGATLLTKMTAGLAAAFILLALTLSVVGQRGTGSVVGGLDAPPAPAPAAGTVPATPSAPTATPATAPSAAPAPAPAAPSNKTP